jgi:hypothetical protein
MLKALKIITLSALVGLSGMTLAPMTASAGDGGGVYLRFGDRDGARFGLQFGEGGRPYRDWRHGRRECSPGEALNKAERMGLRRVRIVDTDRRSITVAGRAGGHREFVTFGRWGRCPVIG